MQITLSTIGRFHTFDLARQLHKRNKLKTIFSGYPFIKLRNEGLPKHKVVTFPWLHAPLMLLNPQTEWIKRQWSWQDRIWFDSFVAANLPDCDIFHAISGSAQKSAKLAKRRGSKYICDRCSSHIRFQNNILVEEHERQRLPFSGIDPRVIEAEESEYDLADAITVPSQFTKDTFLSMGVDGSKVRVIPFGVELARFGAVSSPPRGEFRVLFAGRLSVRKGIGYLWEAYRRLSHPAKKLVLVGGAEPSVAPLVKEISRHQDVLLTGHLPMTELIKVMSESHVLVLPSLEEGLALVLALAMACGCPIIASTNSGAADIVDHGVEGFISPVRDVDAMAGYMQRLADDPSLRDTMGQRALARMRFLGGWDTYGELAMEVFESILSPKLVTS